MLTRMNVRRSVFSGLLLIFSCVALLSTMAPDQVSFASTAHLFAGATPDAARFQATVVPQAGGISIWLPIVLGGDGNAPRGCPTATGTPTKVATAPRTPTRVATATRTPTRTATATRAATATGTPTRAATATRTPTRTATATRAATATGTPTKIATATRTPTRTATATRAATATSTPTRTATATGTPTRTATATTPPTRTATATGTPTKVATATRTPTLTTTPTLTGTATATRTPTPTATPTRRATAGHGPAIANVETITPNVARYDKFEVRFDVSTQATNLDLPFDPNSPPGLQAVAGISVDAEFSADNWKTVSTQPAFFYQPYVLTTRDNQDHFTPSGPPRWTVRFAPQQAGTWQYRLRARDVGGAAVYPASGALSFQVSDLSSNLYKRRGFLRVSQNDPRYFEFDDGTPFTGLGFNDGFGGDSYVAQVEQKMQSYEQYKMDFMRVWMTSAGINGSQWTPWDTHHLSYDGYVPAVYFDTANTYQGADLALKLDDTNPCFFAGYRQGGIPAEPNTTYRIEARVKLSGVTGPAGAGDYGFVIKRAEWMGTNCDKPGNALLITQPIAGDTDWITVAGDYTTASGQYWLGNLLYLARQNATGGKVYIDSVHVFRKDDPLRIDLLHHPNANSHLYFDSLNAAKWDGFIEAAEQHGVYLKMVIDEKNEWIRNHIGPDGQMTSTGSNDNFYAAPGTKVRWLQQAWWRYLIARWGYSTAVHSFEYVNEGDPYNGHHYEAANAMARYFHQNDPSRHMVTTSFWHSFPNVELWSNPEYADMDYADLHAYISTGWGQYASFLDAAHTETRPQYVYSGNASAHIAGAERAELTVTPRGLVIRGPGEWIVRYWMKAEQFATQCSYGTSGGMQRVRWMVDGGARSAVVPNDSEGKYWHCTSPAGTFDWTQFRSDRDRDGNLLSTDYRLVLTDDLPHEFSLVLENIDGTGGDVWFDQIELVSPSGQVVPVIGQFDITRMDEDTAWFNRAYGDLLGGGSPVGARMPVVRGETGIDAPKQQDWNRDLAKDTEGIWLHNNVWGQINPGGMYDLFWWVTETIPESIFDNYLAYHNFMEGIPLSNGHYRDANAQTSRADIRAWGQRDDVNGRMHLWVQNTQHTWMRVVAGSAVSPVSGTVTLPNVAAGTYRVTWWNTYRLTDPVIRTEQVAASGGSLTLTLPQPLADDIAVKVERLP